MIGFFPLDYSLKHTEGFGFFTFWLSRSLGFTMAVSAGWVALVSWMGFFSFLFPLYLAR